MRDVIIAGKDVEVDDARKLLKDTKDKQKQLGSVFLLTLTSLLISV